MRIWSCQLFAVDRTQYILVSNTLSLYSCVLYGKRITTDRVFSERALSSLQDFTADDGQAFIWRGQSTGGSSICGPQRRPLSDRH